MAGRQQSRNEMEDAVPRMILSIVAGLAVAFGLVFATDALFHALAPSAAATPGEMADRAGMAAYVARQPDGVLAGLALGWAVAALAGAALAVRLAQRGGWPGWLVGMLVLAATIANFAAVPHPGWMVALAIVAMSAATWLGVRSSDRP